MILIRILSLFVLYFKEVVVANLELARLVLWKPHVITPALVKIPLDIKSDHGIFLLGSMITLTPGTLLIDVSIDRKFVYVHITHTSDPQSVVDFIKTKFEKKLLEIGC